MVRLQTYVPGCGDVVWITPNPQIRLNPQSGHEQSGRRPAMVISPKSYNSKTGLSILCPVTSQVKGYPFEVLLPEGFPVAGAILSDQVKSLDWRARNAELICTLTDETISEVLLKLSTLISG
jgi:mRNA interferase MazF